MPSIKTTKSTNSAFSLTSWPVFIAYCRFHVHEVHILGSFVYFVAQTRSTEVLPESTYVHFVTTPKTMSTLCSVLPHPVRHICAHRLGRGSGKQQPLRNLARVSPGKMSTPAKKRSCCQKQQEKAQSKRGDPNGSPLSDSFREGLHRSNHL